MFLPSPIFHATGLVLMHMIVINSARGEYSTSYHNATIDTSQNESGRSKRSPSNDMPSMIRILVEYSTSGVMDLEWIKLSHYLANEHLPISMSGYLTPNIMRDIGEFTVYYDLNKCSSVVYFAKLKAFYGYVGLGYFITHLPYDFDPITGYYPNIVRAPYVKKRINSPSYIDPLLPYGNTLRSLLRSPNKCLTPGQKRRLDSNQASTSKHPRTDRDLVGKNYGVVESVNAMGMSHIRKRRWNPLQQQYYLEILIFVTRDIVEKFKKSGLNDYFAWAVRYCIIYFAGVGMIFRKLYVDDSKLYMNIAKVVIEHETRTPFYVAKNGELQFLETAATVRQYLFTHRNGYPLDSFDHVFVLTSLPIRHGLNLVPAMSQFHPDMYAKRQEHQFYNAVPITVVHHESHYAVAVQAISRALDIQIDLPTRGLDNSLQCSSFMQEGISECDGCLQWSVYSRVQFQLFFSKNRNRCFLLNEPRSLRPPGPSAFLRPSKQCLCYGYASYITGPNGRQRNDVKATECDVPLQCKKIDGDQQTYEYTLLPFDGTSCGNRRNVCWNGECTPRN